MRPRVRCPNPSPGEAGDNTSMQILAFGSVTPICCLHRNSLLSRDELRGGKCFFSFSKTSTMSQFHWHVVIQ